MSFNANPRVLLLEDDPLAAWTARRILEQMGCRVSESDCCHAAEEAWLANPFDLIIADYRLPDGLGVELIARMRAAGHKQPVICLTAESEAISGADRAALQIGDVVSKPIHLETFRAVVSRNAAQQPDAGTPPPAAVRRTIGHYHIFPCPHSLTAQFLNQIRQSMPQDAWIALDLTGTTHIEDDFLAALPAVAADIQRAGARICLAAPGPALKSLLQQGALSRNVDMLDDLNDLDSLSRQPTSPCERAALMDSIVI
ncbi:MAG: response regulator [bacterium]